jgi:hypothetical protein
MFSMKNMKQNLEGLRVGNKQMKESIRSSYEDVIDCNTIPTVYVV